MKKILIISEIYKKGGAGNATLNIFEFLKKNFESVKLIVPYMKQNEENIIGYYNFLGFFFYLLNKLFNRFLSLLITKNKFYFFHKFYDVSLFKTRDLKKKIFPYNPDVILVLWFEYILNYKEILNLKREFNAEILIYPFDMFNFTGGCRYVQSCENFKNSCKDCPALFDSFKIIAEKNFKENSETIKKINPKIIFPSTFAKEFTDNTNFLNQQIKKYIIEYPVNFEGRSFEIEKKDNFLKKLKIKSKNKKIIFLGAQDLREWRKGMHNFVYLISILKSKYSRLFSNIIFVSVGKSSSSILKSFSENSICINKLNHDELIKLYVMSDIIVIPSLQEWSSLMMSEVVELNKFIICFDTGSSKDFIKDGLNGFVFQPYDYDNIAKKINHYLLNTEDYLNNRKLNYNFYDFKFKNEKLKKKYLNLFND